LSIKIAIFPSYGSNKIPSELSQDKTLIDIWSNKEDNYKIKFLKARMRLAEIIQALPITHKEITSNVFKDFNKDKTRYYIKDKNNIFMKDNTNKYPWGYRVEIVKVDTNKYWKIDEYDGAEGVEYLNLEVYDKNLKYSSF